MYTITARFDQMIIGTESRDYGRQTWSRGRLTYKHKNTKCAICGIAVGKHYSAAYRPITNGANRMKRICLYCAELGPMSEPAPAPPPAPPIVDMSHFSFEAQVINVSAKMWLDWRITPCAYSYGNWQQGMIERVDLTLADLRTGDTDRASIGIGLNQDFSPAIAWLKERITVEDIS